MRTTGIRYVSLASVLTCSGVASAWNVTIVASDECEALQYSHVKQSVYQTAMGCHFAEFDLSCEVTGTPPGSSVTYQWVNVVQQGQTNPPAGAIWVPSPGTSPATVGWAFDTTGLFTAECVVTLTLPDGSKQEQLAMVSFLAAGGPLKLGIATGEDSWQGAHEAAFVPSIEHDESVASNPYYLQYFNYDPTGNSFPVLSQRPQLGTVQFQMEVVNDLPGMEGETTFLWSLGAGLGAMPGQTPYEARSKLRVGALAASGVAGIMPRCSQVVRFRGRTYTIQDNSDQSPPPGVATGEPNINAFCFTAHRPQDMQNNPADDVELAASAPGKPYGWEMRSRPVLVDNVGQRMPFVWIQERFQPPPPPPTWQINTQDVYWTTESGASGAHPSGRLGEGANSLAYDRLAIFSIDPHLYTTNPAVPLYNMVHHYYAANRRTVGTTGVFAGTYRIKFWTDKVQHIKE
ncbi:MAG: hypothetical protein IT207_03020 [Fimbriimonadaceae bacterium]|nr:hypothetical protein [Fimbriimonadaceae bacterium]